ncbi:hypothetical protein SGCZBJ_24950 [Caulobacter zeae]|uniref:Sulfotransferase family protein n=1 Tax=Caulobacter zeae TaxID=2055137 RepID=A0A2N5CYQ6_9CAUL|nr:sulfotransferase family 2 domain-containing protein [Caulobacter zeae]PLR18886.1 hypothetical protein SGCZBJ_24950 [Caulobacter zeae]
MISHQYRCIFVHIPRCAGTSIETWISGGDWWTIDAGSKHLLASQAKAAYAEFWDDYFKFSIVRNPYDRVISCLKYAEHFGLVQGEDGQVDFSTYHARFGEAVVLEHDHRFFDRAQLLSPRHRPGSVYGNILDEELDFVARFETLAADMEIVRQATGIADPFGHHVENSERKRPALPPETIEIVNKIYDADFDAFNYKLK